MCGWVACKIIVSAPVPVPFLWTLDFGLGFWTWFLDLDFGLGFWTWILDLDFGLGFETWIWDLDLGLGLGTGLGLDNSRISIAQAMHQQVNSMYSLHFDMSNWSQLYH